MSVLLLILTFPLVRCSYVITMERSTTTLPTTIMQAFTSKQEHTEVQTMHSHLPTPCVKAVMNFDKELRASLHLKRPSNLTITGDKICRAANNLRTCLDTLPTFEIIRHSRLIAIMKSSADSFCPVNGACRFANAWGCIDPHLNGIIFRGVCNPASQLEGVKCARLALSTQKCQPNDTAWRSLSYWEMTLKLMCQSRKLLANEQCSKPIAMSPCTTKLHYETSIHLGDNDFSAICGDGEAAHALRCLQNSKIDSICTKKRREWVNTLLTYYKLLCKTVNAPLPKDLQETKVTDDTAARCVSSWGTQFDVVPGTECKAYIMSDGIRAGKRKECPGILRFDARPKICTCNWPTAVKCLVP